MVFLNLKQTFQCFLGAVGRVYREKKRHCFVVGLFVFSFVFYHASYSDLKKLNVIAPQNLYDETPLPKLFTNSPMEPTETGKEYLVSTPGCTIPDMDPFDSEVREHVFDPPTIKCDKTIKKVFDSQGSVLYMNTTALELHYGINSSLVYGSCCYQGLRRYTMTYPEDDRGWADNWFEYSKTCIPLKKDATQITEEFIRIQCSNVTDVVHTDFQAFIVRKHHVEKRTSAHQKKDKVNILMVGIDGVSRLNMIRQLPLTRDYIFNKMAAIEMYGYNKVADNSYPNLMPVFTGHSEEEIGKSCWNESNAFFDPCNFIWDKYSAKGYRTLFGEDTAWMGFFTYLKNGFFNQPTDYYLRPICYNMEKEIGHIHDYNSMLCFGHRFAVDFMYDYIEKFASKFKNDPYFSFMWITSLSHDYLNYVKLEDPYTLRMFQKLHDKNSLNNTVTIFMSDHGIRWSAFRETFQGKMEERLPFMIFLFPDWFKQKYSLAVNNVKSNARKLTSPFDIHETLQDLLDLSTIEDSQIVKRSKRLPLPPHRPRGISLFLSIPENRTCNESGISEHWCTCHHAEKVNTSDTVVGNVTNYIVNQINLKLKDHPQCAKLFLNEIKDARMHRAVNKELMKEESGDHITYLVMFSVKPSDGMFEATVKYHNGDMELSDTISRINLYGNQSRCVDKSELKKFCYCTEN